jgi:hypothetical protein
MRSRGFSRQVGVNHRLKHGGILSPRPHASNVSFLAPANKHAQKQIGVMFKILFNEAVH